MLPTMFLTLTLGQDRVEVTRAEAEVHAVLAIAAAVRQRAIVHEHGDVRKSYDDAYREHLAVIRAWLKRLSNLELAGRNGMHKYNNQDHSMMTALLAARNILGLGRFDTWKVNTDAEYHEEGGEENPEVGRAVPRRIEAA